MGGWCLAAGLVGEAWALTTTAAAGGQLLMQLAVVAGKCLLPGQNVAVGRVLGWKGRLHHKRPVSYLVGAKMTVSDKCQR